jgi:hypothetical protein
MKTVWVLSLCTACVLVAGCSSGESYKRAGYDFGKLDKVAVVDVTGAIDSDAARNQIADFFTMELLKKGYSPVERAQVQSILKEQKFQTEGLTNAEDAVKAGKILNVKTVMVINVPNYKENLSLTAKLIDVEDGSILWLGSGTGSTGRTFSAVFGAAAGAGAGVAAGGRGNEVVGAVAGGVLGGATGWLLSPQEYKVVKKIAEKVCDSLPSRIPEKK